MGDTGFLAPDARYLLAWRCRSREGISPPKSPATPLARCAFADYNMTPRIPVVSHNESGESSMSWSYYLGMGVVLVVLIVVYYVVRKKQQG